MQKSSSFRYLFLFLILSVPAIFFLSGCAINLPGFSSKPRPLSDLSAEAVFVDREAIYNQTIALIESAQSSIYVQQSEFDDPRLMQLLVNKAHSGIEVRILLDQWQAVNKATLDQLKSQNVSIQFYPAQRGQVNNTKYLTIDSNKALIYGPAWTASEFHAHNIAVELYGRAARRTAVLFARDWEITTTNTLAVPDSADLPEDNIIVATNVGVKQQIIQEVAASKESIWIAVPEISDSDLIQALLDASERLPEVCLILDGEAMSKAPNSLERLQSGNINIRYFPRHPQLGLRMAVFDDACFIMSSFNWTRNAFVTNHELSITVPSPEASAKLGELFWQNWEISAEYFE